MLTMLISANTIIMTSILQGLAIYTDEVATTHVQLFKSAKFNIDHHTKLFPQCASFVTSCIIVSYILSDNFIFNTNSQNH